MKSFRMDAVRRHYITVSLIAFNTVLLLVVLNVGALLTFALRDYTRGVQVWNRHGAENLRAAYPDWTDSEIKKLLRETYRPLLFEPYTLHREAPFEGRYVRVHEAGFRYVAQQGPWPLSSETYNIFFFGGSTAFGYGVTDEQTIASQLQETLVANGCGEVRVYNFGRGYYYSTQERILVERLITMGHIPDLAIFLDGLNDLGFGGDDVPWIAPRLTQLWERRGQGFGALFSAMPLVRAVRLLGERRGTRHNGIPELLSDRERIQFAAASLDRWKTNKRLIEAVTERFSIETIFVWQPAPHYGFDLTHHPFIDPDSPPSWVTDEVYPLMRARRDAGDFDDVLWLADMQRDQAAPLYVDAVHYNPAFSREIALEIAVAVRTRMGGCQNAHDLSGGGWDVYP